MSGCAAWAPNSPGAGTLTRRACHGLTQSLFLRRQARRTRSTTGPSCVASGLGRPLSVVLRGHRHLALRRALGGTARLLRRSRRRLVRCTDNGQLGLELFETLGADAFDVLQLLDRF